MYYKDILTGYETFSVLYWCLSMTYICKQGHQQEDWLLLYSYTWCLPLCWDSENVLRINNGVSQPEERSCSVVWWCGSGDFCTWKVLLDQDVAFRSRSLSSEHRVRNFKKSSVFRYARRINEHFTCALVDDKDWSQWKNQTSDELCLLLLPVN